MNTTPSTGQLAGRRILVTGSARGLGFAFAKAFCEQGARVAMVDLREELLAESVARLRTHAQHLQLAQLDAVRRLFAGRLGPIELSVDPGPAEVAEIRFANGFALTISDL